MFQMSFNHILSILDGDKLKMVVQIFDITFRVKKIASKTILKFKVRLQILKKVSHATEWPINQPSVVKINQF